MGIFGELYFTYHRRHIQRTLASIPASLHNRGNHSLNLHTVQFTLWCPVLWVLANVSTCAPSPRGDQKRRERSEPDRVFPAKQTQRGGRWLEPNANRNSPRGGYILAGERCHRPMIQFMTQLPWGGHGALWGPGALLGTAVMQGPLPVFQNQAQPWAWDQGEVVVPGCSQGFLKPHQNEEWPRACWLGSWWPTGTAFPETTRSRWPFLQPPNKSRPQRHKKTDGESLLQ